MSSDRNTAPSVIARVSMLSVHMPSTPHPNTRAIDSRAVRQFDVAYTT